MKSAPARANAIDTIAVAATDEAGSGDGIDRRQTAPTMPEELEPAGATRNSGGARTR